MKNIIQIKIGFLFFLTAFLTSCQNDNFDTLLIECQNISRSNILDADTAVLQSIQDAYFWVENKKIHIQKVKDKYSVM